MENHSTSQKVVRPCWSCHGPVAVDELFCQTCHVVQPPAPVSHFQRLGISDSFDVDVPALDHLYFDLQRKLHPDRFATKSVKEKMISQQQATALNDAYETLKDPLRRADYMIHMRGIDVSPEGCNLVQEQSILLEAMDMRERLSAVETMTELNALAGETKSEMDKVIVQISKSFQKNDIESACKLTTRLKYLHKMMGEVRHVRGRLLS